MGLERIGDSSTLAAIQKRIRQRQKWLSEHPAEAAAIDARVEADRKRLQNMTGRKMPDLTPAPASQYSRQNMRRRRSLDDEDEQYA